MKNNSVSPSPPQGNISKDTPPMAYTEKNGGIGTAASGGASNGESDEEDALFDPAEDPKPEVNLRRLFMTLIPMAGLIVLVVAGPLLMGDGEKNMYNDTVTDSSSWVEPQYGSSPSVVPTETTTRRAGNNTTRLATNATTTSTTKGTTTTTSASNITTTPTTTTTTTASTTSTSSSTEMSTSTSTSTTPIPEHCYWRGIVTDTNSRPLSGVSIRSHDLQHIMATTDNTGKFNLVPKCIAHLWFSKTGYQLSQLTHDPQSNVLDHTVRLEVLSLPYFVTSPQSMIMFAGDDVDMYCEATGQPTPYRIQWFKGGVQVSGVTGGHLHIDTVSVEDAGVYNCRASSVSGDVISSAATLTVKPTSEELCGDGPKSKKMLLPTGCTVNGDSVVYVGHCGRDACTTNPSQNSPYCCVPDQTELLTVDCGHFTYQVSVVESCTCGECGDMPTTVSGMANSFDSAGVRRPISNEPIEHGGQAVATTSVFAYYSLLVPADSPHFLVTMREQSVAMAIKKVPYLRDEATAYSILFDVVSDAIAVTHGDIFHVDVNPYGQLTLPLELLYYADGRVYEGAARLHITVSDVTDTQRLSLSPSDFSTMGTNGKLQPFLAAGWISVRIVDPLGQSVTSNKKLKWNVPASLLSASDDQLWLLQMNYRTATWKPMEQFMSADDNTLEASMDTMQLSAVQEDTGLVGADLYYAIGLLPGSQGPICYVPVAAYHDHGTRVARAGVLVTATVRHDQYVGYQTALTDASGSVCLATFCQYAAVITADLNGTPLLPSETLNNFNGVERLSNTELRITPSLTSLYSCAISNQRMTFISSNSLPTLTPIVPLFPLSNHDLTWYDNSPTSQHTACFLKIKVKQLSAEPTVVATSRQGFGDGLQYGTYATLPFPKSYIAAACVEFRCPNSNEIPTVRVSVHFIGASCTYKDVSQNLQNHVTVGTDGTDVDITHSMLQYGVTSGVYTGTGPHTAAAQQSAIEQCLSATEPADNIVKPAENTALEFQCLTVVNTY